MKTIIIDNGHGSETPGKRSPKFSDGTQMFEFEFNRAIAWRLADLLEKESIPHINLVPEQTDISLPERCKRANAAYKQDNSCILISIHANAASAPEANGYEVFTTPGQTKSDAIATAIFNAYKAEFPELKARVDLSDKDPDKEEHFYIIKNTHCPAVLIECGFMSNEKECRLLLDERFRDRIAKAIFNGLKEICL